MTFALKPSEIKLPVISGDAGIGDLVRMMKEPSYLRLIGKSVALGVGLRAIPRELAVPAAVIGGMYLGLEIASWMEEEAKKNKGPVIDVTPDLTLIEIEAD